MLSTPSDVIFLKKMQETRELRKDLSYAVTLVCLMNEKRTKTKLFFYYYFMRVL